MKTDNSFSTAIIKSQYDEVIQNPATTKTTYRT